MNRYVVLWLTSLFVFLAALSWARPAIPSPAFKAQTREGPIALRLQDEPCSNAKVKAHLETMVQPQFLAQFRAATLDWSDGKRYASCWIALDGQVFSVDEEGTPMQPIPYRMFVEEGV